jgi:hypothetical protein
MKTLMTLEITETRPERMRVIIDDYLFLVQCFSNSTGNWITLAEHSREQTALIDCIKWYQ